MGHQHDSKKELKPVPLEKESHPFLEKNDITYLSMIRPLLSSNAQKLVSFFVDFDNQGQSQSVSSTPSNLNLSDLMSQLSPGQKNSIAELAPTLLGMLSNSDSKGGTGGINPALLTSLLSMLNNTNNKKED